MTDSILVTLALIALYLLGGFKLIGIVLLSVVGFGTLFFVLVIAFASIYAFFKGLQAARTKEEPVAA